MEELKARIIRTIKYFDRWEYPLTIEEVGRWLFWHRSKIEGKSEIHRRSGAGRNPPPERGGQKSEIGVGVDDLLINGLVETKEEFYFLPGREKLVEVRKTREKISRNKIKKAQAVARILQLIPYIKMISVCSNLGYLNAPDEADIDLLVVTKKNKIWSARFWAVVMIKLLGLRPKKNMTKDKICLSYFVDEEHLDLSQTKVSERDYYLAYLTAQNLLLYDEGGYFEKFKEANMWLHDFLLNFDWVKAEQFKIKNYMGLFKNIMEMVGGKAEEQILRKISFFMMNPELRGAMNRGDGGVIINDGILKLHLNDKREEVNKEIEKF